LPTLPSVANQNENMSNTAMSKRAKGATTR